MSPDVIDYNQIINQNPWLTSANRKCIISPDSDGFLCGLLVTNYLNWEVSGFYDGKILITSDDIDITNYAFLDIEINRKNVGSIGNHLVEYNRSLQLNNHNFNYCVQPNMLRQFDGKTAFQRKYPFGTLHLLIGILQAAGKLDDLPNSALSPLLFVDGVGNNLFGYPENCIDWINYLKIDNDKHILNKFLCENDENFYQIMRSLKIFFELRDTFNAAGYYNGQDYISGGNNKRTGHKLKISNGQGQIINLVNNGTTYDIHGNEADRVQGFIKQVAPMMGWKYIDDKWNWSNFHLKTYRKGLLSGASSDPATRLNNATYKALFDQNPLSLAMTASNRIEYTI